MKCFAINTVDVLNVPDIYGLNLWNQVVPVGTVIELASIEQTKVSATPIGRETTGVGTLALASSSLTSLMPPT